MSHTRLLYHIVFSTKERRPLLAGPMLPRVCEYLGGMVNTQGGRPVEIGGVADHIHLVASLGPSSALSDAVRDLKANSSNWIHRTWPELWDFAWQEGYSAFSVSPSVLPRLAKYVRNQAEHHKTASFEDELKRLLETHGVEYDERYL